jgi:hypothetical protein
LISKHVRECCGGEGRPTVFAGFEGDGLVLGGELGDGGDAVSFCAETFVGGVLGAGPAEHLLEHVLRGEFLGGAVLAVQLVVRADGGGVGQPAAGHGHVEHLAGVLRVGRWRRTLE